MNHVFKVFDFIAGIIGGGSVYASTVMLLGGSIELPFDFEISLLPSLFVAIPFSLYQLARAYSLYEKTQMDKKEKEQNFRIMKYETDKILDGYASQQIALTPKKSDFKELTELQDKHRAEVDKLLAEIERKRHETK